MVEEQDFPTQLGDETDGGALRWTTGIIVLTALALAVFNAGAITAWTEDLVPGPAATHAVITAERWKGATAQVGLDTAYGEVHRLWKRLEEVRWPDRARDADHT